MNELRDEIVKFNLAILDKNKINYEKISEELYKVEGYFFWPISGLYKMKEPYLKGYGLFKLVREIKLSKLNN